MEIGLVAFCYHQVWTVCQSHEMIAIDKMVTGSIKQCKSKKWGAPTPIAYSESWTSLLFGSLRLNQQTLEGIKNQNGKQ